MLSVLVPFLIFLAITVAALSLFSLASTLRAALEVAKAAQGDYRRVHREALARPALRD